MGAARHRLCSPGLGGTMPPATAAPVPARGKSRGGGGVDSRPLRGDVFEKIVSTPSLGGAWVHVRMDDAVDVLSGERDGVVGQPRV
jgi:hypothetical protein